MQFDIYVNNNESTNAEIPYLLDLQHTLHERLPGRLVAPLSKHSIEIKGLTPWVDVAGTSYLALIPEMASISKNELGQKVGNCTLQSAEIINAIDLLITGF